MSSKYSLTEKMQLAVWYVADRIKRNLSLSDPKSWNTALWNLYGSGQTESGINVDEHSALNLSAVYAAINIISSDIATLPLGLFKTVKDKRKRITDHPSLQVLAYRSNPLTPAINFRKTSTSHILSWGNMYAEIVRDGMGNIVSLWLLTPDRVSPKWRSGTVVYEIDRNSTAPITLPRERVLHISGLGYNGITGYSVISKAAESIGLSLASEKFGARYFGANTNMGGAIKYPRALGPDAKKNLAASLSGYTGSDNSHRWMILEQGMEIEKLGFSPDDSQFLQTRQFQVPEIARWFNLPPHKLKDLTRSTFSNIEEQETEYVVSCLVPWLTTIEQNYNIQLLTEKEHRLGYYFKHNVKGLLRGSSTARADYYTKRFYLGTITPNEIRAFEDEDPLDTDYADKTYIQMNLIPLEDIDKEPVITPPQNMPGEQPTEEEPPAEEEEPDGRSYWRKILDHDRVHVKLIEYRSVVGRDKVSARYYPLIRDAAERIILKEAKAISKNITNGKTWIDDFYKHMPEYIRKQMAGVLSSFQETVIDQAAGEVGVDIDKIAEELRAWVKKYFDVYVMRHVGRSTGQINQLMDEENGFDLVTQRMDEWMDKRPEKIAIEESVRAANAAAQFVFWSGGFSSVWRVRGAQTCPYCQALNGRKVKSGEAIFTAGEEFEPKGAKNGPMKMSGGISHPPLHASCDCYISHG